MTNTKFLKLFFEAPLQPSVLQQNTPPTETVVLYPV